LSVATQHQWGWFCIISGTDSKFLVAQAVFAVVESANRQLISTMIRKTMLRGTTLAGGQPIMLAYPFGEGKVVVSSIFPDWSYGMYNATRDDKIIVRDLVAWSKGAADMSGYSPGERLTVTQKIKNVMRSDATQIKLTVVDPDRNEVTSTILPAAIASMDETEAGLTIVAPDKLGIYFVDYSLLDDKGDVVQPQTEGARFAVAKHGFEVGEKANKRRLE